MTLCAKCLAMSSLIMFVIAAYMGFVDVNDPKDIMNKLKGLIDRTLKWQWLQKRYILTRVTLGIGLILAIWGICIS